MSVKDFIVIDVKQGIRTKVYPLYLLAAVFMGLLVRAFPDIFRSIIVPVILFIEPSLLGITFVGAIILFEKKDRVPSALATTPVNLRSYIIGKLTTMVVMSLLVAFIILGIGVGFVEKSFYVFWGVLVTSALYTLVGIGIASKHKTLDDYFVPLLAIFFLSLIPFLGFYGIIENEILDIILHIIPSYESIYLIGSAFRDVGTEKIILSSAYLLALISIAYVFAERMFYKYAVEGSK